MREAWARVAGAQRSQVGVVVSLRGEVVGKTIVWILFGNDEELWKAFEQGVDAVGAVPEDVYRHVCGNDRRTGLKGYRLA